MPRVLRISALAAGALALLLAAGSPAAPPERPQVSGLARGVDLTSAEALGWTAEQHATALRYSRGGWALWLVGSLLGIGLPALVAFSGTAGRMAEAIARHVRARPLRDAAFIAVLTLGLRALGLPLALYRFHRETAYGFATQSLASWLGDEVKEMLVGLVAALIFLLPVWAVIRRFPRVWWLIASAIGVSFSVLAIAVAPVFVAPLFNTFTPLKDETLKQRILDLAHREGIPAEDVYEVDASRQSRHDNAYVVGLLGTQRIVLYDTLIAGYDPEEVEFVMGHEMGHYILNHVWKGVAVASAVIVLGAFLLHRGMGSLVSRHAVRFRFREVGSIASLPLAMALLSAYLLVMEPVTSAASRFMEHQADVFALEAIGGRRDVAVSAFQRMAARNLSDPNPPAIVELLIYSHPSIGNRIRFAAGG